MIYHELDSTETVIVEWSASAVGYATTRATKRDVRFWVNETLEPVDWRISVFDEFKQEPLPEDET